MKDTKTLIGQKAICEYLRIGRKKFLRLIPLGLPVQKINIGYVSNKDLLDSYFVNRLTSGSNRDQS